MFQQTREFQTSLEPESKLTYLYDKNESHTIGRKQNKDEKVLLKPLAKSKAVNPPQLNL